MDEKRDEEKPLRRDDPDMYIRTLASTWGHLDLIRDWMQHHKEDRAKVTELVLFPAAMYGQLEILQYAIGFGDVAQKDSNPAYPGWTLMHFAVQGTEMSVVLPPENTRFGASSGNFTNIVPGSPGTQPHSSKEVYWNQLDIVKMLAENGVPLSEPEQNGLTPSQKACQQNFLEGAILLDILALQKARESAQEHTVTPGLAVGKLPNYPGWVNATRQLTEWAYKMKHYDVLNFCHQHFEDLSSQQLILSGSQRPLLMDAIRNADFVLLRRIIEWRTSGGNQNAITTDVLTRVYEYDFRGTGKWKESALSYACSMYFQGSHAFLNSLLSPQIVGGQLTHITLSEIGLRHLPHEIMHENLKSLDVRGNNLNSLPANDPIGTRLNWNCPALKVLNISNNQFDFIHPDVFRLPGLNKLFASNNNIQGVSLEVWTAPALEHLDLSHNIVSEFPCPTYIQRSDSSGAIRVRASTFYKSGGPTHTSVLQSSRQSHVNFDVHSSEELHRSGSGFALTTLDLTWNQLTEIPRGLPCLAPRLINLKVAKNKITELGYIFDYPPLLQTLDASVNGLHKDFRMSCEEPLHNCVQSQLVSTSPVCPHFHHVKLTHLKFLYLNNNRLEDLVIEGEYEQEDPNAPGRNLHASSLLFPRLQGLRLSNNHLVKVPGNIHKLEKLCELTIDGNPQINYLPLNIHRLSSLFTFKYQGIGDPIVHELVKHRSTSDILYYLRAREQDACKNTSLRLFIIGHFHKGKTTLLAQLRGKPADTSFDHRIRRVHLNEPVNLTPQDKRSTVGIECGKWVCKQRGAPRNAPGITFYTWDFAGQEEYYLTHQCFLTNRALYLLVWDVNDDEEGIKGLSIWLQNLQAKAPTATVIVVGTHLDLIPRHHHEQMCRRWRDKLEKYRIGRRQSKSYPHIRGFHFVGCPPQSRRRGINIDTLNDLVYNVAVDMDSPKDNRMPTALRIKILDEMIPKSYDNLRKRIEELAVDARRHKKSPVIHKDQFCEAVKDIIDDPEEVDTAIDFLHTTTGVVLHFNMPWVEEYYIIDPQRWFDLCALVISPDNVSRLVPNLATDYWCGLLSCQKMDHEFRKQGFERESKLIRAFLKQYHIIHQISDESCLVPSAIPPHTDTPLAPVKGSFPFSKQEIDAISPLEDPDAPPHSMDLYASTRQSRSIRRAIVAEETGLVYRRMLHLPPIPSGFWSKVIALFIQKRDFGEIIHSASEELSLVVTSSHIRQIIGNVTLQWRYWKTGIMLFLEEQLLLRVNSLRSHEFTDPLKQKVLSETEVRVQYFQYQGAQGTEIVPRLYTEVIEVIVPEVHIVQDVLNDRESEPVSPKILTKALEIIDEVLKNHCEYLASTGIYTINDMLHVIPCPFCFGDEDNRAYDAWDVLPQQPQQAEEDPPLNEEAPFSAQPGPIHVFTVEECIKKTFVSDHIDCPEHGKLEFSCLAPDLVFADLADRKLDKQQLSAPISRNETPDSRGSFGMVLRRYLDEGSRGRTEVAVKIFEQYDAALPDSATELTKNYSDMRYELNKLSSLVHPYIVRFIGVFTNPHSFVLEWAPQRSLEHLRMEHTTKRIHFCPTSIFLILLQMTQALDYLHSEIGIVHNDLRCSNVLVFRFPNPGHCCSEGGEVGSCIVCLSDPASCGVLVKLADMGICANPAARRTKNHEGIRQFVPECLNFDAALTQKVDIFNMGTCLYELMSLRGLPPPQNEMTEGEYKALIQTGRRPQFVLKDTPYPLLLFQFLEECWQQEHFKRPSAAALNGKLQVLTGLSVEKDEVKYSPRKLLMDTFVIHPSYRISATHLVREDPFLLCLALQAPDGHATSLVTISYHIGDHGRTELKMERLHEERELGGHVSVMHMTPDMDLLCGCSNSKLLLVDSTKSHVCFDGFANCDGSENHGEIRSLYYHAPGMLLVVGFSSGNMHISKCTQGVSRTLFARWRQFCCRLQKGLSLYALECVPTESSTLETWCGTDNNTIEVWSFQMRADVVWIPDKVEHEVHFISITPDPAMMVTQIKLNHDSKKMLALLHNPQEGSHILAYVDIATKEVQKLIHCGLSVASFVTSPTRLIIGTYEGRVHLFDSDKVLGSTDEESLASLHSQVLKAHFNTVYCLLPLKGHIGQSGMTSCFPTFVGRAMKPTDQDFLVTVGYGTGYQEAENVFRTSVHKRGTCLNAWIV